MSYPRISCYAANRGYGFPLVPANNHAGTLDMALIAKLARYSTITLDLAPWYALSEPCRTDALIALRRLNPSVRILGYFMQGVWRLAPDFTVQSWDKTFWGTWHNAIKDSGGFGDVAERNPDGTPKRKYINPEDLDIFTVVKSSEEALAALRKKPAA